MIEVGSKVKVLEPFDVDFPSVYEVTDITTHEDGQVSYLLDDQFSFDSRYLEIQ